MFSKHTEQEAHHMSTTQQRVTDEAIRDDIITPPTPKSNSEQPYRLFLMASADKDNSVLRGARSWHIQKGTNEFVIHVNQGKVVATDKESMKWTLGQSWGRVKTWLSGKGFSGTPGEGTNGEVSDSQGAANTIATDRLSGKTMWNKPTNSLDL